MIIGVTGLALGFVIGGASLVGVLGVVLQRSVDSEIDATARQVAILLNTNALPVPVPVPAGDQVQVVDAQGRVRAASADADPLVPLVSARDLDKLRTGKRLTLYSGPVFVQSGPVRVVAVNAGPPDDPQIVVVARSMADVGRGLELLRGHLLVWFPLLLLGSAVVAWHVIGAALRPVEQLRRGAEEITGSGPGAAARLPVSPGRDEIHRLAVTLNGMLDRLEAGRARQREFVADAAHELRSPLANMRTQLEVAGRLGPGADWPAVGDDLLADTERLARLVDDLLLLARSDAALPPSRLEPVELNALLQDVAAQSRLRPARWSEFGPDGDGAARPHQPDTVPVTVAGDAPVWTVGVPDELRRVVGNLVDNAVRHARTGVVIATMRDGQQALLTVTDDGPGIPVADRDRVFERFTRLDDSRTLDTGGAGLGLAIVRELVRRHNGTITLADAAPVDGGLPGLRVEVRLPAVDPE